MIDWSGPRRQACFICSRSERDRTMGVTVDDLGGRAHCFRCGFKATTRADAPTMPRVLPQRLAPRETLSDYGRDLWAACRPVSGPARAYLEARCCAIPPADGDLRWHPALKHPPSGHVGPALVALLTDATTREPRTLHRTWVRPDGRKADVDPPRMQLGGHRKAGAVCRLWPDEAVALGLGVAEGIETALSLAHAFQPVWAAIDAGNLATLPVLDGVESLTIGADNDESHTGQRAAEGCARRWAEAGREVRIVLADAMGDDLNDEVAHA
jgi:putative DNA primase/helicase